MTKKLIAGYATFLLALVWHDGLPVSGTADAYPDLRPPLIQTRWILLRIKPLCWAGNKAAICWCGSLATPTLPPRRDHP